MKLYNKKLNSLEQLHRERVLLRYRRRQSQIGDLNPLAELGRSKVTPAAQDGLMGFALELLGSGSRLEMAMAVGKPLLKLLRKRRGRQPVYGQPAKPRPSRLKKVFKGILITFLVGKAVQMSVRYIGMYKRRKALEAGWPGLNSASGPKGS